MNEGVEREPVSHLKPSDELSREIVELEDEFNAETNRLTEGRPGFETSTEDLVRYGLAVTINRAKGEYIKTLRDIQSGLPDEGQASAEPTDKKAS